MVESQFTSEFDDPPQEFPRVDFLCCVGGIFLLAFGFGTHFDSLVIGWAVLLVFLSFPVAVRCETLGFSALWWLGLFVPVLNAVILFLCASVPGSFVHTRRLDRWFYVQLGCVLLAAFVQGSAWYANWKMQ